jgi:hypothetical protein
MITLPPLNSEARNAIDVAHVAEILNPVNVAKLETLQSAKLSAKRSFSPEITAVYRIVLTADGTRWLIKFFRSGFKPLWNFDHAE